MSRMCEWGSTLTSRLPRLLPKHAAPERDRRALAQPTRPDVRCPPQEEEQRREMYQGFARMAPLARRRRRLLSRFAPAVLLAALLPGGSVPSAGAAVTIGSNLAREPDSAANY